VKVRSGGDVAQNRDACMQRALADMAPISQKATFITPRRHWG
jgi:hypothetical protein